MKITDLKCAVIGQNPVVRINTDEGIYGWGESGLSGRELAVVGAIDHLREFLVGRNPLQIGRIWQEVYRSQYFEGGRVLQAASKCSALRGWPKCTGQRKNARQAWACAGPGSG